MSGIDIKPTDEISANYIKLRVKNWAHLIKSRLKWVFLSGVVSSIIGFSLSYIIPKSYQANLTFILSGNDKKLNGYSSIASQFGFSLNGSGGIFQENDNITDLFLSRTMITRTLLCTSSDTNLLLTDKFLIASGIHDEWNNDLRLYNISYKHYKENPTLLQDSVLSLLYREILKHNLTVNSPNPKSDVLSITVTSRDEDFSKTFTEKLLENVSAFYIENQTKKSQDNVNILRHQVDSVKYLLNSALLGAAISSDNNPNLNPALHKLMVPSQKRLVDVEMNKAILEELVKNLEIAEILLRKETPLFMVIDKPVLPLEYKSITKLKGFLGGFIIGCFLYVFSITSVRYIKNISV